ncbi:16S rRNA (adenine1518-N6/adenine1519-N6)-dimethyltransferase [Rubricella aquisinus]|uniref:Ribosomal RNA small subunit methyltransferase A n=1 Tax=Rubricella aquisinus TaxID=2028108 RepID=A0A840WX61_9RHOB|nr:16S rRNA (adenine(1518)-N(6)/adenine(1519)-N(6))-dimethyltransferase RsmA [Rubricella aquisinus]MBB5514934.1 16S rRNA (adenine1518-N6/adenine1519-N6)-dimethyltransferase [Rubricella aquisinus]
MSLDGLPPLRDVIARHDLSAKKALGQNFLLDLNLTSKIARAAGDLSTHDVLEVGPGPGGLTRALLMEGARKVVAVERDPRCLPALTEVAAHYPGRLEVIEGDALKTDLGPHLISPVRIVANLPYNVGTELLVRWIEGPPFWDTLTLMFQKEVADRIIAQPGTSAYGRLAILAQWTCEARRVFDLPPSAFTPPPKVTSSVVHLARLPEPRFPANPRTLSQITAAGFNQRRKMLRSSLKSLHPDMEELLQSVGIAPTERAERVSLEAFCALARALDAARKG